MKAALISLGSISSRWTSEAMKDYFEKVDTLDLRKIEIILGENPQILYEGSEIPHYDCIFAKGSFRYAQLLQSLSTFLYHEAYMPIAPESFTFVHDKLLTHLLLEKHGIPIPKTYISATIEAARNLLLKKVHYPIIMKFPKGTGGKGVMYAENYATASSILDALHTLHQPFILQEYIETGGTDVRAIVAGDKVIASMKRIAAKEEKRANIHSGGKGGAYTLDNYMKKIAVRTAKILQADICAIDILESIKGPLVIEANLSPGLQGITKATKLNVANLMAKYLFKKTKEHKKKKTQNQTKALLQDIALNKKGSINQTITRIDFRGNRMLLPEFLTGITRFTEHKDILMKASKGKLVMKDFKVE